MRQRLRTVTLMAAHRDPNRNPNGSGCSSPYALRQRLRTVDTPSSIFRAFAKEAGTTLLLLAMLLVYCCTAVVAGVAPS